MQTKVPILGFVGYSGSGKTTLLVKIIEILKQRGIRLGLVKHAHHHFDIDHPGKDSFKMRKAGAQQVLVASAKRFAYIVETPGHNDDPKLSTLLNQLNQESLDIILVEGFKHVDYPKVEIYRESLNKPSLYQEDSAIIAIITDNSDSVLTTLPIFDINKPNDIADFIINNGGVLNRGM